MDIGGEEKTDQEWPLREILPAAPGGTLRWVGLRRSRGVRGSVRGVVPANLRQKGSPLGGVVGRRSRWVTAISIAVFVARSTGRGSAGAVGARHAVPLHRQDFVPTTEA